MSNKLSVVFRLALAASALVFTTLRAQTLPLRVNVTMTEAEIINAGPLFDIMADRIKPLDRSTFSVDFQNTTPDRQPVWARMHIEAWVTLDEDHERLQIFTSDTRTPFLIPPEGRTFLASDSWDDNSGDMQFMSVKNDASFNRVKDKVTDPAGGGRVPSGTYEVAVTLTVVKIGSETVMLDIPVHVPPVVVTNPSNATLNLPFADGHRYASTFPQFQWVTDMRRVRLSVYEKRPEHQSNEDAVQASDPFLEVVIDRRASGGTAQFTYPQSSSSAPGIEIVRGPRPLERGKTYVVEFEGLVSTIAAEIEPHRTIRSFSIDDPASLAQQEEFRRVINSLPALQEALQSGSIDMNDFQINQNGISLNGRAMTLQELQEYLSRNNGKHYTIQIID
ncbi:MAG: hypothetical protein ACM3Q4_04670 [Acidobacteriota bacterium]